MAGLKGPSEKSRVLQGRELFARQQTYSMAQSSSVESFEAEAFDDMKQLVEQNDEDAKASLSMASFNYINSIIGSGVIGIPYALHEAGFGFGMVLLCFVALATDYSLVLMVRSGHLSGRFSYQGIMEAAFGRAGYILLSILQFIYPFIAMISYHVVVGDTLTKVLARAGVTLRRDLLVFGATVLVTTPLCLHRNVSKLAKVSFLSLVCIGFILVAILIRVAPMGTIVPETPDSWQFFGGDAVPALGIMAFAFMCHHNAFLIYRSIGEVGRGRWDTVTHGAILASLAVSAVFGVAGYVTFGSLAQGDLLENYCPDDDLMNAARLMFCITILLTFPLDCMASREVAMTCFKVPDPEPASLHYGVTIGLVLCSYLVSISTDCLGLVLELNGVLAAVPLAFVLPAACYLRLEEGPPWKGQKLPAVLLGLFGIGATLLGLWPVLIRPTTCSHGHALGYCSNTTMTP